MDKYKLETGKKYIREMFDPRAFYNIPEYQRPYVWGDEQVNDLLNDIYNAYSHDHEKEYFIGCMVWNTKNITQNDISYTYQDILDGQQRFITLYLLHGVIRDLSTDDKIKNKVNQRLKQEEDTIDKVPERNRIDFAIREDKAFLEEYLLTPEGTLEEQNLKTIIAQKASISTTNMAQAIISLHNWICTNEDIFDYEEEDYQKFLSDFFSYLSNKVLIIYLTTPNNLDDAYNLFTVLNSRGLQLQTSDILRAQNLRLIEDERIRKKYAKKWADFEDTIGSPYKSIDEFLWALVFAKMKYRSDDNESLIKAFEFIFKQNKKYRLKKGKDFFDFVEAYIEHYKAIVNDEIKTRETGQLFSNLVKVLNNVFGNQHLIVLMHYRECFGEYKIIDFLIKIDNLFSVYWLTGKRNLQTRIFLILRKMQKVSELQCNKNKAAEIFLKESVLTYYYNDEKASTKLSMTHFYKVLKEEEWGNFVGKKINKTRYLLLKLDILMGSCDAKLQFDTTYLSVEHIMPRNISQTQWNIDEDEHQFYLHCLGNIVLLDRRKNSSLSNKLYSEKKNAYKQSIEMRANTNFIFMDNEEWDIDTIKKNQERVIKILKLYYKNNSIESLLNIKKSMKLDYTTT